MKTTLFIACLASFAAVTLHLTASAKARSHRLPSHGVVSTSLRLPPVEGAYHGTSSHIFLDGQAVLTCSSHGIFQSNDDPPKKKGERVDIDYLATFVGELALSPPLVERTTVYPIDEEIRMVERVTFTGRTRRSVRHFNTELVSLDFRGSGFPEGVLARESTQRRTLGHTYIQRLPRRRFLIETSYDVWMELSTDGGRTWHQQALPVTMSLMPMHVD